MRWLLAASLLVACDAPRREAPKDMAPADAVLEIDSPPFVPPPPTIDAGPPPMQACSAAMPECKLPPSTCLDQRWLIYYTDGTCLGDACRYTTNMLYCGAGCYEGGCLGGFT